MSLRGNITKKMLQRLLLFSLILIPNFLWAYQEQLPESLVISADTVLPEGSIVTDGSLINRLDSVVCQLMPLGAQVSIQALDLDSQVVLYERQPDALCRPASTMKLLTAISAMDQDRNFSAFSTKVYYDGTLSNGILDGDLWVIGGFDPEFMDQDMDTLVSRIKSLSIRQIKGHIYGDASLKDSLYWGSGWMWDDNPSSFQPYLSTLMFNKGKISVTVRPTKKGTAANIQVEPVSSYYSIENLTRTNTPSRGSFKLTRDWLNNSNKIIVSGNVASRRVGELNIYASEHFFMQTLVDRLSQAGINCNNTYNLSSFSPSEHSHLAFSYQTSFQEVLEEMLKESDNLNAEAMLWRMGYNRTGKGSVSASDGVDVIKDLIGRLGLNAKNYKIEDGCGLSMYDYISCRLLVSFLRYAYTEKDIYSRLYKALPISGVDGTLKNRMKSSGMQRRVHAKTGSYTGINTLAGYVLSENGHQIAFAVMIQNVLSASDARKLQDAICLELFKAP